MARRLTIATRWRRLDEGGLDDIAAWYASVKDPRLVAIDTFAGIRPAGSRTSHDSYSEDYKALTPLQQFANEKGLAALVSHHTRKMEAEDPLDTVSGTLGLAGCADTVFVLKRDGHGTTLYGRGRDIEEFERAVEFNRDTCRWRILGDAEEVRRSETRRKIVATLEEAAANAKAAEEAGQQAESAMMTPQEIAAAVGLDRNTVDQQLFKMWKDGEVDKPSRGKYRAKAPKP